MHWLFIIRRKKSYVGSHSKVRGDIGPRSPLRLALLRRPAAVLLLVILLLLGRRLLLLPLLPLNPLGAVVGGEPPLRVPRRPASSAAAVEAEGGVVRGDALRARLRAGARPLLRPAAAFICARVDGVLHRRNRDV